MTQKRILWSLLLLLTCLGMRSQEYFNLTAQQVRIDSMLPVFTHSFPLSAHYADSSYTVQICYPEFLPMSSDDVKRYEQISGQSLPTLPDVVQQVSVSRKKARLEVSFIPLVWRDGKYQKLVSFQLKLKANKVHGMRWLNAPYRANGVATTSALASGKWVKIRVPASGIYQLTSDLVQRAGFSNINNVRVYGYGGAMQPESLTANYITDTDDLQEVPVCDTGGRRLFWAQGPVSWNGMTRIRNPYSQYGYYFLTEGDGNGLSESEQQLMEHFVTTGEAANRLYEVDDYAWFHGGRNLYDAQTFSIGQARDYTLASPLAGNGEGVVTVVLTAYDSNAPSSATITVNGETVGTMTINSCSTYEHANQTKSQFQVALKAQNTIRIQQTTGGVMRLDYIALHTNGTSSAPTLQQVTVGTPEVVGTIANQNLHGDEAADMVIVIPASRQLQAQAERLKAFHEEHDGMRVRLITADELYNEFSSGTPDANAYRRYLRMLYERAQTESDMPSYLVLFGDGAWDNRMLSSDWRNNNPDDFLLCYESENSFSATNCYVSDDFFCMLDEGEGGDLVRSDRADVAVGRFPARTEAEAKIMVDKLISYANNTYAGSWQNEICLMGDDGNNNLHMQDADSVARLVERMHPEYMVKRIMWDAYQRVSSSTGNSYPDVTRLIVQQMQSGALIMNYCGHGGPYGLSHELVVQLKEFRENTTTHLPLWVTASCDIMPFDGQEENIGETVLFNKHGGAVAFFGTTRTVYSSYNRVMNLAFMSQVLEGITVGEAVRLAKNSLITTGQDHSTNKLQYTYLGDPALRLAYPTLKAVVDDINGASVSENEPLTLRAGTTVTIRGHVEKDGQRLSSYDGTVSATVRDAEEVVTCRLNDSKETERAFVYTDRTKVLFHGSDSVQAGQFALRFIVPQDISYTEGTGLINLYAIDNSRTAIANGTSNHFVLAGATAAQQDTSGPEVFCYLNAETFTNGDKVNLTPYFVARISDDSGINATGNGIGHDIQLVIDGQTVQTYVLNDYFSYDFGSYTSGTVGYSIPTLTAGRHKLQFRVWDTQNNSTTKELSFVVVEALEPVFFDVECTRNPADTHTSFRIIHDRTGSEMDVILDVFDLSGRHLWQHAESGVPTDDTYLIDWDLTSGNGSRISTGVYLYRVRISSNGSSYASRAKKMIIISNK